MQKNIIINTTLLGMLLLSGCEQTTSPAQNDSTQTSVSASVDKKNIVTGENVNFSAPSGALEYAWYNEEGKLLSKDQQFNRAFYVAGEYKTILKVTYPDGHQYTDTTLTKVDRNNTPVIEGPVNNPPVARASISEYEICTGDGVTFYGDQSSDSDGSIVAYEWREIDGILLSNQVVFDRGFPYPATYHKTLTVTDDQGATNSMTVDLVVKVCHQNEAPTAIPQSMDIPNDTPKPITLTGTDPENDNLTYTLLSQPLHGSLSGTAPNPVYTPDGNYTGKDSFTFQVNDGSLDSTVATIDLCIYPTDHERKLTQEYRYDNAGNILYEGFDFNDDGTINFSKYYTYDTNGNLLSVSRDVQNDGVFESITTYTYDVNGNMLSETIDSDNDGTPEIVNTYTYDTNGNRLSWAQVSPSYSHISYYTYDLNGNLLTESSDTGINGTIEHVSTYAYDTNGQLISLSSDSGNNGTIDTLITYTYDSNGYLISRFEDRLNDGIIDITTTYTYDSSGNILTKTVENLNPNASFKITYTYDANGNKLSESHDSRNDGTIDVVTYYTYDADGNIIKEKRCLPNDKFLYMKITTYDAHGNVLTTIQYGTPRS